VQSRVEETLIGAEQRRMFTRQSRWILIPPEELNDDPIPWSEICGCECIARLLFRKGFHTGDEVRAFFAAAPEIIE